ncbi:excalibur calcium-binding domain-containing protein [Deinococcus yavapaiensis]|uniref:Beta-lactamase superfamily II metal-dependent hydrolase n=1 Tax=Deinococcus yavapaiensis KR-236 TaxID=694435 RepID=A0A318S1G2_9DEIO|nr:excalibur calcium-binding domain-containing protein [Deinococcus yavapaiensis]PYE48371.1 beta-lactamase superfamily II metal-dependent hydrolase [Deinococcus yavapaiensis KR-236]
MKRLLLAAFLLASTVSAQDLVIRFLDVGQGDAVLVTTPDGKSMLYDAGRGRAAAELLRSFGVKQLDLAVMSQGDADHIGGFEFVAQAFKPRTLLNNGLAASTQTYARVLAAFQAAGTQGLRATARTINLGASVKLQVIPAPSTVPAKDQNANSVGVLLTYGTFKMFLGGDAEPSTTKGWAAAYGPQLRGVNVYKALHHGSKHNDSAAWLSVLQPKVVVIGVGPNNYGHPSSEALALYKNIGATVFRTDVHGTVTFTVKTNGTFTTSVSKGPAPTTTTKAVPVTPLPSSNVTYANCSAVRAAGAAPIRVGEPGYSRKLDRDGDGIACE